MADIELVIKIPEEQYNMILLSDKTAMSECVSKEAMMHAIKNGASLPKGHGRLIDADELLKEKRCFEDFDGAYTISNNKLYAAVYDFSTNKYLLAPKAQVIALQFNEPDVDKLIDQIMKN